MKRRRNRSTILGAPLDPILYQSGRRQWESPKVSWKVWDGDTIYRKEHHTGPSPAPPRIAQEHRKIGIRSIGGDTPEVANPHKRTGNQPGALAAKTRFETLLTTRRVIFENPEGEGKDKYGRHLKYMRFVDSKEKHGKQYVTGQMISEGHSSAFPFGGNLKNAVNYLKLETGAKFNRRGIHGPGKIEIKVDKEWVGVKNYKLEFPRN